MPQKPIQPEKKGEKRIPIIALISRMTGESPEEIFKWTKDDWLAFAKRLREG